MLEKSGNGVDQIKQVIKEFFRSSIPKPLAWKRIDLIEKRICSSEKLWMDTPLGGNALA